MALCGHRRRNRGMESLEIPAVVWRGRIRCSPKHTVNNARSDLPIGFHLATTHARELHLVQYPSFMWIRPSMLEPILPRFTTFQSVTSLSFYSLSVRHFEGADIQSIFGHFFQTVRKLVLEDTCATARGLFHFLCNFHALDDLSISNPEWDHEIEVPQAAEASAFPSLHGTLSLRRLGANSADFVGLLAGLSTSFRRIWLVDCQLPSMQINLLLKRLAPSQAHPCIDGVPNYFIPPFLSNRRAQLTVPQLLIFHPAPELRESNSSREVSQWRKGLSDNLGSVSTCSTRTTALNLIMVNLGYLRLLFQT